MLRSEKAREDAHPYPETLTFIYGEGAMVSVVALRGRGNYHCNIARHGGGVDLPNLKRER